MKLSKYFTLEEMIHSDTALRHDIDNTINDPVILQKLTNLAIYVADPIRIKFGKYSPTCAYRCPPLNKLVKGQSNSQHCKGEAMDFEVIGIDNYKLATWIKDNIEFDQLILEYYKEGVPESGWVHVSYVHNNNRKQILSKHTGNEHYLPGLIPMKGV
jgi:hypothetical protein